MDGSCGSWEIRNVNFSFMGGVHDGSIGIPNSNRRSGDTSVCNREILKEMSSTAGVGDDASGGSTSGCSGVKTDWRN